MPNPAILNDTPLPSVPQQPGDINTDVHIGQWDNEDNRAAFDLGLHPQTKEPSPRASWWGQCWRMADDLSPRKPPSSAVAEEVKAWFLLGVVALVTAAAIAYFTECTLPRFLAWCGIGFAVVLTLFVLTTAMDPRRPKKGRIAIFIGGVVLAVEVALV
ncbi:MAG: hypothetical protein ABMA01_23775, partial [Chthoniobacteraceae bacterium]